MSLICRSRRIGLNKQIEDLSIDEGENVNEGEHNQDVAGIGRSWIRSVSAGGGAAHSVTVIVVMTLAH